MISMGGARRRARYGNQMAVRILEGSSCEQRVAIIGEFPIGTLLGAAKLSIRNRIIDRIIAGMAVRVVVVEGAQYSGSLIKARRASPEPADYMGLGSLDEARQADDLVENSSWTSFEVRVPCLTGSSAA
jgi:hypothetical protein